MRVRVRVDRAADRDALGEVDRVVGCRDREDRLGVRAHDLAEAIGDPRQRAAEPAPLQQLVRAECSRADDHAARTVHLAVLAHPGAGALGDDFVALRPVGRADRPDVDHGALRPDPSPEPLGEPEVVLDQRVLRPVRAADHAAGARDAAGPWRPVAAEVRVVDGHPGLAEEHAHARLGIRLAGPDVVAELAQEVVRGIVGPDARDAEHPLGLVVVRRQRALPVVELRPSLVGEERADPGQPQPPASLREAWSRSLQSGGLTSFAAPFGQMLR